MKIEAKIEALVHRLGEGEVGPVPYDTAWVARVPQFNHLSTPAFPKALQWLRDNQLSDGSWGADGIVYAHSDILNTFSAILAFAQWGYRDDEKRIQQGLDAIKKRAPLLVTEAYQTIRFQLLLSAQMKECSRFKLPLPEELIIACQRYPNFGHLDAQFTELYKKKKSFDTPDTWWYSLEMLGAVSDRESPSCQISETQLSKNGSIFVSPAATAYALTAMRFRGKDLLHADNYLKTIINHHQGGASHVCPIDEFELSYALDFLLKAGIPATSYLLAPAIKMLYAHFIERNGVGVSKYLPLIDSDDSAVAISSLYLAGYPVTADGLFSYFNGNCMVIYPGDLKSTLSVHINTLNALKLFRGDVGVDQLINKIAIWIDKKLIHNAINQFEMGDLLLDQWHFSPYYNASRIVFVLYDTRSIFVETCIDWMLQNQYDDGGWGWHGKSTAEETAFVSLALNFWLQLGNKVNKDVLMRALNFLSTWEKTKPNDCLWIGKVLYSPSLVTEAAILGAQYALIKTLGTVDIVDDHYAE